MIESWDRIIVKNYVCLRVPVFKFFAQAKYVLVYYNSKWKFKNISIHDLTVSLEIQTRTILIQKNLFPAWFQNWHLKIQKIVTYFSNYFLVISTTPRMKRKLVLEMYPNIVEASQRNLKGKKLFETNTKYIKLRQHSINQ